MYKNKQIDPEKRITYRIKRFLRWFIPTIIAGVAIGAMMFSTSSVTIAERKVEVDTTPEKIKALQADVIDRLLACESAGKSEDAGLIVFDTNNQASIGQLQFQIKTVQQYEKQLHGRDISRKEAIMIALDTDEARALATEIIFNVDGGIYNWQNCAIKHNLVNEIAVLKKLAKE